MHSDNAFKGLPAFSYYENDVHQCQNCPALFLAICTAGLNCFDEDLWEIHYIIEYKFTTRTFVLFLSLIGITHSTGLRCVRTLILTV